MSRVAKRPIVIPQGVDVRIENSLIAIKGKKGELSFPINAAVLIERTKQDEAGAKSNDVILVKPASVGNTNARALAGTHQAIIQSMVIGVTDGYEITLEIQGVGFRAEVIGKQLKLTLGYSHPIMFDIPEGIQVETTSQTVVVVRGCDKQKVGQVAANIRGFRPPERYKGKGIRYKNEVVVLKETKKK